MGKAVVITYIKRMEKQVIQVVSLEPAEPNTKEKGT